MEVVGSRLGRASSRYGPSTTTAVFSGPVRKWKRKWVHVSSTTTNSNTKTTSSSKNSTSSYSNGGGGAGSKLLLFRWTPVSSPAAEEEKDGGSPPRRRFRYTPATGSLGAISQGELISKEELHVGSIKVVVLEDRSKAAKKVDDMAGDGQLGSIGTSKSLELNRYDSLKSEAQDHEMTHLDLELSLKENSDPESDSPNI